MDTQYPPLFNSAFSQDTSSASLYKSTWGNRINNLLGMFNGYLVDTRLDFMKSLQYIFKFTLHPFNGIKRSISMSEDYGSNYLNSQNALLNLLNDNNQKQTVKAKKPKKPKHPFKQHFGFSDFSYCYPNESQLIKVNLNHFCKLPNKIIEFEQLQFNQQVALISIALANIVIDQEYQLKHSTADYNPTQHLAYPLKTPAVNNNELLRDYRLIANPSFDICNYDFRSFDQQFGYSFAEEKDLPFVADEMISFTRNNRRHEIFLELDNRTESNQTQIQKIMNYIWYALHNPDKDVDMVIAVTDGSLAARRLKKFTNVGRKLGNLASLFLRTYITGQDGNRQFLSQLYSRAKNLHIYLSGVSEAHVDIANILLGSNPISDQIFSAYKLSHALKGKTNYNVKFSPSKLTQSLLKNPQLLFNSEQELTSKMNSSNVKGILRYFRDASPDWKEDMDTDSGIDSEIGTLSFKNRLTGKSINQTLLFGNEHTLDTIIQINKLLNQRNTSLGHKASVPVVIYPSHERPMTAITLPEYKKYKYSDSYNPNLPYLVQPLLSDNLADHKLIRWIMTQYSKEISSYFEIGAISKSALKKNPDYGSESVQLLHSDAYSYKRSTNDLKALLASLNKGDVVNTDIENRFASQLRIDEIPLGVIKALEARWPQKMYYQPRFMSLPYDNEDLGEHLSLKQHYSLLERIIGLNSTQPRMRQQILKK